MPYSSRIVSGIDYPDVRRALGFAGTDTTNVPDDLIEGGTFLPWVEGRAVASVPAWETILDDQDSDYDADRARSLKTGVVLWIASRIAILHFAAKVHQQVTRRELGPAKVQFHDGPDWVQLASDRASEAAEELYRVDRWGESGTRMQLVGAAGPTRAARDGMVHVPLCEWQERLLPPVVLGKDYR